MYIGPWGTFRYNYRRSVKEQSWPVNSVVPGFDVPFREHKKDMYICISLSLSPNWRLAEEILQLDTPEALKL